MNGVFPFKKTKAELIQAAIGTLWERMLNHPAAPGYLAVDLADHVGPSKHRQIPVALKVFLSAHGWEASYNGQGSDFAWYDLVRTIESSNAEWLLKQSVLTDLAKLTDTEFVTTVRRFESAWPEWKAATDWHLAIRQEIDMRLLLKSRAWQ